MKIYQIVPTFAYGDAIGNSVVSLNKELKENGYESEIYASAIDGRIKEVEAKLVDGNIEGDILIYHASCGDPLNNIFKNFKGRKWIIYHNVTDPIFFLNNNMNTSIQCEMGLNEIADMKEFVELCIADSEFNKECLEEMGYKCPIEVLPILIRFSDYDKEANEEIIKKYRGDGYTNILFTGRVAPNKKQEDIIESFYYYKKNINEKSRLFIVGGYGEEDKYYKRLKRYVEEIGIEDVIFTGHIPFADILGYYRASDIFLCLSEHEGFCVPLVEAMYFGIPIIAYDSTAIKETLGGSGLLLEDKNPKKVAEAIDIIEKDKDLREKIIENEKERLEYFSYDNISKKFLDILVKYK